MKILMAVDGSPASLDAVSLAGRLLDPAFDEVAIYFSPAELQRRMPWGAALVEGASEALFEEATKRLPATMARKVEVIVSTKSAAVGIIESAAGWSADLVVVGARGSGSLERLMLGSVSRAVVHGTHLPVLVVRSLPPAERALRVLACFHAASAAAVAGTLGKMHWPAGTQGETIGVTESLLAGPLPAWLEKRVRDPDTAAIANAWQQEHDDELVALKTRLQEFQRTLPAAFGHAEPVVAQGNPGEQINARTKADGVDMVAIGRTPSDALTRWVLGSTSEAVLTHSHASVLLVPVEKK